MWATVKLLAVWVPLGTLAGLIGIPYSLLVRNVRLLYRVTMGIIRLGLRAAGISVQVEGLEHIPEGRACIFMCNHVSNLDPPVILPVFPGFCSVLLKKELMSIPLLGTAMRLGGFVPVERGSRRDAAQKSVAAAANALGKGLHMIVFPEGTRSPDGRLSTFKKGPFFLAQQTGATIIPVAICGTERMMRKGVAKIYPGLATVRMQSAIDPAEYGSREELLRAVRASIARGLPEEMRPAAE
jgi:1-acyl-sn-glycerol-3-phosphate acyltransferase